MPNSKWRRFLHLLQACADRGWRTHIVWTRMPDDPELSRPFSEAGCRILIVPAAHGNFDRHCVLATYRLIRQAGCDVFHCHNVHTSPLIGATLARAPVRVWSKLSMSSQYEEGRPATGLHRLNPSHRVSGRLAHAIFCISTAVRDELSGQGLPARKLRVVPVPVELERYVGVSPAGVRESLGIPERAVLITTVGHAVPVKGWDVLLRAFKQVAAAVGDAYLLLVGSTVASNEQEMAARLHQAVSEDGLGGRVHFAGQRKDVAQILAASDVFVLPSRSEGLSCALLEALASGLPAVATRAGGIPDVIRDRDNGLLFDREDAAGLAERLLAVIRDEGLRSQLAARARPSVERFGLAANTAEILAVYDELLRTPVAANVGGVESRG